MRSRRSSFSDVRAPGAVRRSSSAVARSGEGSFALAARRPHALDVAPCRTTTTPPAHRCSRCGRGGWRGSRAAARRTRACSAGPRGRPRRSSGRCGRRWTARRSSSATRHGRRKTAGYARSATVWWRRSTVATPWSAGRTRTAGTGSLGAAIASAGRRRSLTRPDIKPPEFRPRPRWRAPVRSVAAGCGTCSRSAGSAAAVASASSAPASAAYTARPSVVA
mmetsp:Transcript_33727/g.93157  ORF Transcript_33727/g.93157 Transcript_33727/m.93157 type:complete len:221 (-) Transcript_33727:607-1269(-)